MSFRWLLFDSIDPALGLTPAQRRQVLNRVHLRIDEQRAARIYGKRALIIALLPSIFYIIVVFPIFVIGMGWWSLGVATLILFASSLLLFALLGRWTRRPLVLLALRHYGYEVCLRCGYYLKGVPAESLKCPECGAKRESLPLLNKTLEDTGDVA